MWGPLRLKLQLIIDVFVVKLTLQNPSQQLGEKPSKRAKLSTHSSFVHAMTVKHVALVKPLHH